MPLNDSSKDHEQLEKLSANELAVERTELAAQRNELAAERTEFARYRTGAAADRTLLAWIRTSLTLIGFGFGIPTIARAIEHVQAGPELNPFRLSVIIGLSFILVGLYGTAAALKEHRRTLRQIDSGSYTYQSSPVAEITGGALVLIGVVTFIGVLLRALDL